MRNTFHIGLLVAALSACGGEEKEKTERMCYDDSYCSSGRFCGLDEEHNVYRCLGNGSSGEGGSSGDPTPAGSDSRCGNSPLNGRYMWNVGNCESGTITPGDPETCTFTMLGDSNSQFVLHYDGLTIHAGSGDLLLRDSFTERDLFSHNDDTCRRNLDVEDGETLELLTGAYQCALLENSSLRVVSFEGKVCLLDNLRSLKDEPFPGNAACELQEWGSSGWYNTCFREREIFP